MKRNNISVLLASLLVAASILQMPILAMGSQEQEPLSENEEDDEISALDLPEITDRILTNNILSNHNSNFEDAWDDGKLYWWGNENWNSDHVDRVPYEEGERPDEGCGSYYGRITVDDETSTGVLQFCDDSLSPQFKPGAVYGFSYYAKLAENETSGDVKLDLLGEYYKTSEVTYDAEIILNADEWQKVTGTLVPADYSENPLIQFEGSEGVSYCIDNLMIAELSGGSGEEEQGDNLIKNPNFEGEDLSVWKAGNGEAVISAGNQQDPVFDEITTYGVISDRQSNYDCFAQDITDVVENGKTYRFSFWARLSDAYQGAPEEQRVVAFAPYYESTEDGTVYLGEYSSELTGASAVLEPGVWTQISGTYQVQFKGELNSMVARFLEQGTDYGTGDCVRGEYQITGVTLREIQVEKPEIEYDIPDAKDAVYGALGGFFGTGITASEMSDATLMQLVTKHFNAITVGNELKPDALFGYSNSQCPGTETAVLDGEEIVVPKMDFSRAEGMLETIQSWNESNPDSQIKVRGHVLVWHSQTPEWFFHENYDKTQPYVDAATMNKRLEWYIRTVLEHFTGEDSKYRELFYGWDVVNEAVSNSGGYRTDQEDGEPLSADTHGMNSSWWHIYQSNEYIINAFRYANKYAPADQELYYNDYGECAPVKKASILQLLSDVKNAEGTRIDAMGMQAHYDMSSPSVNQFREAVTDYANAVGSVQLTELDMKASNDYDGSDAAKESEYIKMAYRYKALYDVLKDLKDEGCNISGITFWGVVDKYSWLQSSSNVGGGSTTNQTQCPLLFDDNYQAKPIYWAFVDPAKLPVNTQRFTILEKSGENFANGIPVAFDDGNTYAEFIPVWTQDGLEIKVTVADDAADDNDGVTVYVAGDKLSGDGIRKVYAARSEGKEAAGGYEVILSLPLEAPAVAQKISIDVVVENDDTKLAYNDNSFNQETSSKGYAEAILKPFTVITKGTAVVDGEKDAVWDTAAFVPLTIRIGAEADAAARLLWDDEYLYIYAEITDACLNKDSVDAYQQDSVEIFIDENNGKTDSYDSDDKQYRINYHNEHSFSGINCTEENMLSSTKTTETGYIVEAAFRWTDVKPKAGDRIGFEMQINDADNTGKRIGTLSWYDETGNGWAGSHVFGTALLMEGNSEENPPEPTATPEPTTSLIPTNIPNPNTTVNNTPSANQGGSSISKGVRTADENPVVFYIVLAVLSIGFLGGASYTGYKRKIKN